MAGYQFSQKRYGAKGVDERTLTADITLDALAPTVLCHGSTVARNITMPAVAQVVNRFFWVCNKSATAILTYKTSTGGTISAVKPGKVVQMMVIGAAWKVLKGATA